MTSETSYLAHKDVTDALDRARMSANATVEELALALANARVARWLPEELTALAEALRAALIARYIARGHGWYSNEDGWPANGNYALVAIADAEQWIRAALVGTDCNCSMQRTKTKPSRLVHMPSCPARDAV